MLVKVDVTAEFGRNIDFKIEFKIVIVGVTEGSVGGESYA